MEVKSVGESGQVDLGRLSDFAELNGGTKCDAAALHGVNGAQKGQRKKIMPREVRLAATKIIFLVFTQRLTKVEAVVIVILLQLSF